MRKDKNSNFCILCELWKEMAANLCTSLSLVQHLARQSILPGHSITSQLLCIHFGLWKILSYHLSPACNCISFPDKQARK